MVECQDFSENEIRLALTEAEVSYAGGESDVESIRDQEAGPNASTGWYVREPYFYRRENNLNGATYRRRMLVNITDGSTGKACTQFEPEAEEDKDGYVKQASFHLKCTQGVDPVGLLKDLLLVSLPATGTTERQRSLRI